MEKRYADFHRERTMFLKTIATMILLLSFPGLCFAAEFRDTHWSMSRDEVIASENGTPASETIAFGQRLIVYKVYAGVYAGEVTYMLLNDRLMAASMSFKNDRSLEMFNRISGELSRKHGKPEFQTATLIVWRLEDTEIALAHLPNNTCYAAYWEKGYFARINRLSWSGGQ
jgi:hypothetical protein